MSGISFWANKSIVSFGRTGADGGPSGPVYAEDAILGDGSQIGSPWDTVKMAGIRLPGVCTVKGVAQFQIDNKKGKGLDGSTITRTGYQPGPFEVACLTWTDTQWDVLQKAIDVLWDRDGKKARLNSIAVDINHPGLQFLKIKSCALKGVSIPEPGPIPQTMIVRFQCVENTPGKKKAVKTAKGSSVGRVQQYASGTAPNNTATPKPSANAKKNLGPHGQPAAPASGSR